jgi:hypothetical protein
MLSAAKHLCISFKQNAEILRFAQDDTLDRFLHTFLRRGLSYGAPSELSYAAKFGYVTLVSNFPDSNHE